MTRPYAEVIGDPISHSKSPLIHNFWLAKLGIDAEYRRCHVRADELADYFARRRGDAEWRGCNVTIPHKVDVLGFVDRSDSDALKVGASNVVTVHEGKLEAGNTDVSGIVEALADATWESDKIAVLVDLVGAGGAARAAMVALPLAGFSEITVLARDKPKADALSDELGLGAVYGFSAPLSALVEVREPSDRYAHLIVNASPLGMHGYPSLPIRLANYPDDTVVLDMVYSPLETPLLNEARALGFRTIDGLAMLIGQAAVAFEKFFGQAAPREHDAELRALLTTQ